MARISTFTKTTFIDNSAPPLSAANLNKNEDQLDALTTALNGVFDADTVKGTTPGTQGLTYLSKATQATMAAILLTDLKTVDGAGSGLEADTVPGYGIGVVENSFNGNIDTDITKNGFYSVSTSATGTKVSSSAPMLHVSYSASLMAQLWFDYTSSKEIPFISMRVYASGSWGAWAKLWNSAIDGPNSGLDAGTVSGSGIGTNAYIVTRDLNTEMGTISGFYYCNSCTNIPSGATNGYLVHIALSSSSSVQIYLDYSTGKTWYRANGGSPGSWALMWNSTSDGNGGQPPAPKPQVGASDADIGRFRKVTTAINTALVLPAGGTWAYVAWYYNTTSHAANVIEAAGVAAGGTTIVAASASCGVCAFIWRIA